jgi:hypothetical protein
MVILFDYGFVNLDNIKENASYFYFILNKSTEKSDENQVLFVVYISEE